MPREGEHQGVAEPPAEFPPPAQRLRLLLVEGRIREAIAEADAVRFDAGFADLPSLQRSASHLAALEGRLARGDLAEAMAVGDALSEHLDDPGRGSAIAHYGKAELSTALGDPQQSVALFRSAGARLRDDPVRAHILPWRVGAALALLHTRDRGASALAAEHLELVTGSGSLTAMALALRTQAACDHGGRRVDLLREARVTLTGVTAARLSAQIDTDLAAMLALGHEPTGREEAVHLLRGSAAYASSEELWPLRARAMRVLHLLGAEPPPLVSPMLSLLTVTERRVCELAASGLSNRQVAERLRMGIKSVEGHLSRAYRKLGISSRTGLSRVFGALA